MLEPNRNYVIEEDGSIHKMLFCGDSDWEENAVTSIQEIRNKAIDDFAEVLRVKCLQRCYREVSMYTILEIAEQLKGEKQ